MQDGKNTTIPATAAYPSLLIECDNPTNFIFDLQEALANLGMMSCECQCNWERYGIDLSNITWFLDCIALEIRRVHMAGIGFGTASLSIELEDAELFRSSILPSIYSSLMFYSGSEGRRHEKTILSFLANYTLIERPPFRQSAA